MEKKWMGIIAYIIFFIPLIVDKEDQFGRFHANQGLLVFLLAVASAIIGSILPLIGWLGSICCLVLAIIGIVNGANEEMKELPIIGSIKIIK